MFGIRDIHELAKKIVETPEFVRGVTNAISPLIIKIDELVKSQKEINNRLNQFEERLNLLETKVDQLSNFVHDNIKHNSPKSSIQDKYSFNEDDLVNIGEFSSLKKGQNDSGKKLSNNINNKKKTEDKRFSKFNFELFITNPNESKPSKNINTKKIKRYDSSLFINTNRGEDKKRIKPDNKLKLEKKKDPFYTLFTDKTKRLKKYYSKGSFSKKKK